MKCRKYIINDTTEQQGTNNALSESLTVNCGCLSAPIRHIQHMLAYRYPLE
jgi:hypothetical protein